MDLFGRNYAPVAGYLDLTDLRILVRLFRRKINWKESDKLSEEVADRRRKEEGGAIPKQWRLLGLQIAGRSPAVGSCLLKIFA